MNSDDMKAMLREMGFIHRDDLVRILHKIEDRRRQQLDGIRVRGSYEEHEENTLSEIHFLCEEIAESLSENSVHQVECKTVLNVETQSTIVGGPAVTIPPGTRFK